MKGLFSRADRTEISYLKTEIEVIALGIPLLNQALAEGKIIDKDELVMAFATAADIVDRNTCRILEIEGSIRQERWGGI
jgi:hypothetical protein